MTEGGDLTIKASGDHVFQGRYKAILVERDSYLLELARYVVLNPVRAAMVRHVRQWKWSAYHAMVGSAPRPVWLHIDSNNLITYRDRRHRGFGRLGGLLAFYTICGLGVIANVGVASALFTRQKDWLVAAAAGALVGTVWNYVANSAVTWRRQ
jgi:hypothetical protein